jgi:hypothetical protein
MSQAKTTCEIYPTIRPLTIEDTSDCEGTDSKLKSFGIQRASIKTDIGIDLKYM